MKIPRLLQIAAAAVAVGVFLSPAHAQRKKVIVFTPVGPVAAAFYMAENKGFFKDEKLEVDIRNFTSGAEAVEGFLGGRANLVVAGHIPTAKLWTYPEIAGVCPLVKSDTLDIIVARKEIASIGDLRGKRVGTRLGTAGHQLLVSALKKAGIPKEEVTIRALDPTEGVTALDRGDIEAHAVWEPFGIQSRKVSGDKVYVMLNNKGYFHEVQMLSSTLKFIRESPEETKGVIRALARGSKYIQGHFEEAVRIVSSAMRVKEDVPRSVMEIVQYDVVMSPEIKVAMEHSFQFNLELGAVKRGIDWSAMFDPSLLRAVDPKWVTAKF